MYQRLIILFTMAPAAEGEEESEDSMLGAGRQAGGKWEAASVQSGREPLLSEGPATDVEAQRGSDTEAVRPVLPCPAPPCHALPCR